MPFVRKKVLLMLLKEVDEACETSRMENCSFTDCIAVQTDKPFQLKESEVTDFIRQRTKLWRESWITGRLEIVSETLGNIIDYKRKKE